jgi:Leucine-rich repeat (LRR) protein
MALPIQHPSAFLCLSLSMAVLIGCDSSPTANKPKAAEKGAVAANVPSKPAEATIAPEVASVQKRLVEIGATVKLAGGKISEIVIQDGSNITDADVESISKLAELKKLQILNCRVLNDEMVTKLGTLKQLTSLALTNTVINDASVDFIVKTFPKLTELDLSSNTNVTTGAMTALAGLTGLKSLTLVQNRFNELSTRKLKALTELKSLDLRGNMEAGNMTLGVVGNLPNLTSFKHRSTAVTDDGMEKLAANPNIENLLIQDFMISGQSGLHLAKLTKLKQLEIFRCQGFDSQGVIGLKGLGLDRLTLRDLPAVDDQAMEVLSDLPKLKRLYLHELETVSDQGLKNLSALKTLELLDIWSVSNLTDATVDVIAALPNLRELSLRTTGITDAAVDKILAMPNLQTLTLKENSAVSDAALKKLSGKKWTKLDIGSK